MPSSPRRKSPASTRKSKPATHAVSPPQDKAAAVLAGAREIFLALGFSAATTDLIQQAAGVSKATVYSHYPNKETLFTAMVEAECEYSLASIRKLKFSDKSVAWILEEAARAYLDIVLSPESLALYRVVVAEAPRFPELARRFYVAGPGAMNGMIADVLDRAMTKGELDVSSVGRDAAAALFANMVRGEAQMQCLTHPNSRPSAAQRDRWAREAVTGFLLAFGKSNTRTRR
jgi:TetR/AcrR family transcriptional regulator, mexJK operon transcriptional repressor